MNLRTPRPVHRKPSRPALGVVALAAIAALSANAVAQEQDPNVQVVEVHGLRASAEKAQDIKQNADQIVDSIVADDIGKLPDVNVAEALQRISGVQISRNRGEGDRVQVRGLQQVQTLLNGRDVFTAGRERGLAMQDIPAELLAGADVYKTPTAQQEEGGIGGIIDLRTRRPFDFAGSKVAGTVKVTHADLVKKTNDEGSLLLSNRWHLQSMGDFGALFSVTGGQRDFRSDSEGMGSPALIQDGSNAYASSGQNLTYETGARNRLGSTVSLQWRPNVRSEYTADFNHSEVKNKSDVYGFYGSPFWANYSNGQGHLWPVAGTVVLDDKGNFQAGQFWGASMNTWASAADDKTSLDHLAVAGKWHLSDNLLLRTDLSHANSVFNYNYDELDLGTWADSSTYTYDLRTKLPSAYPSSTFLTDPSHYWANRNVVYLEHDNGKESAVNGDLEWSRDEGIISRIRTGVRFSDRKAVALQTQSIDNIYANGQTGAISGATPGLESMVGLIPYDNLLDRAGDGTIPRQWLGVTNSDWLRNLPAVRGEFGLSVPQFDPNSSFDFRERSSALYVMSDLDTAVAGMPLTGNVGVRAVQVKSDRSFTLNAVPRTERFTDNDVLPSMNLRLGLTNDVVARVSLSKVVTRPNFDQLTPGYTSINNNDHTAWLGNPNLRELSARQADTSLEYYYSKSGNVYAAAFYKKLSNFIQYASSQQAIPGLDPNTLYTVTSFQNGEDGDVRGAEFGGQIFFQDVPWAPNWLSGFGMQANFTVVNSSAPSPIAGQGRAPLQGLSRNSYNLVGMYDHGGFSARVAYNYRSSYNDGLTTYYPGTDGTTAQTPITAKGYGMVDAYLSYAISDHLKVALEANNITNTIRHSNFGVGNLPANTYADDRRVAVSLHAEL